MMPKGQEQVCNWVPNEEGRNRLFSAPAPFCVTASIRPGPVPIPPPTPRGFAGSRSLYSQFRHSSWYFFRLAVCVT